MFHVPAHKQTSHIVRPFFPAAPVRAVARLEAIKSANAHTSDVGLPTYTELVELAKSTVRLLQSVDSTVPDLTHSLAFQRCALVTAITKADPAYYGLA